MSKGGGGVEWDAARNRRIEALVAGGLTWGEAAARAGVTRNTVAGVIWRAQQRGTAARAQEDAWWAASPAAPGPEPLR